MSVKNNTLKILSIENILIFVALIAVGMRFIFLGTINGGLHVDEAYAGYEAYSLYNYGVDSWGYHNPVYFISWGSGMNVLASYLMIPFVALLGNSVWAIRLPQAILQSLAILTVYKILKMTVNKRLAAYTAFFMAVCPWHFMLSRWGLESNMCVAFISFGSYFLIKYFMLHMGKQETGPAETIEKGKNSKQKSSSGDYNIILAAIMFGLSLYCYAADWVPVAAVLSFWILYYIIYNISSAKQKKAFVEPANNNEVESNQVETGKHKIGYIIAAILVLAIFALPLLLFLLVNMGYIPEIRSFISVPKMVVFRNDELGANLHSRIHSLAYILIKGTDVDGFRMWNAYQPYGLFYIFSLPVMMVGVFVACRQVILDFKAKRFSYAFMLLGYSVITTCIAMVQGIDIIQINYLIITMVIYIGIGIYAVSKVGIKGENAKARILNLGSLLLTAYLISFILFANSYFGDFQKRIGPCQMRGADKALDYALELYDEKNHDADESYISVTPGLRHANILFYTASSPYDFINTVTWQNYPNKYLNTASFGPYIWEDYRNEQVEDEDQQDNVYTLNPNNIYVIETEEAGQFINQGYRVTYFQDTAVAVK